MLCLNCTGNIFLENHGWAIKFAMQFASWNFVEVYIFLPTMNYSNQSKVLTSYSTVKKDVEEMENEESGKEIRIFVYVCMLCLKHSIRLIRYENDLQALSMCVCLCDIYTLFIAMVLQLWLRSHVISFVAQLLPWYVSMYTMYIYNFNLHLRRTTMVP